MLEWFLAYYTEDKTQFILVLKKKAFSKLVYTPEAHTVVIELEGGKKKMEGILQDIQFHPVSDKILHVDFYQLDAAKEITMEVPVKITGTSPGCF